MPVVTQGQVPMIPNVQKTVEVLQIQYVDKIVDAPVAACDLRTSPSGRRLSPGRENFPLETESADGTSDEEHGLVQEGGDVQSSKVDETRERHAAGENPDLLPVAPNMEAGGSHPPGHGRGGANRGFGPNICERSAEWLSSWCVGKGSST